MKAIVGKPASAAGSGAAAVSGSVIGAHSRTSPDAGPRKQRSKAPAKAADQPSLLNSQRLSSGRIQGENHSATTGIKSGRIMRIPPPGIKLNRVQFGKRSPVSLASGTISWPAVPFEEAFPTGNAQGYGSQTGRGLIA